MTAPIVTGEAYVLRSCWADMTSHNGFVWPREGLVEAPDWRPDAQCGHGLHGFLWGEGDGSQALDLPDAVWIVARIHEWIDLGGTVKFPRAEVVFAGSLRDAAARIVALGARGAVIGATITAGHYGAASAGWRGTATAGDDGGATAGAHGTASAGGRGAAIAGDYGTAIAGDYGTATAGWHGTAIAGDYGTAIAGDYGTAIAGDYGIASVGGRGIAAAGAGGTIQIAWLDESRRPRLAIGYVGENGIKANTPYRCDDTGNLVEAQQ